MGYEELIFFVANWRFSSTSGLLVEAMSTKNEKADWN